MAILTPSERAKRIKEIARMLVEIAEDVEMGVIELFEVSHFFEAQAQKIQQLVE